MATGYQPINYNNINADYEQRRRSIYGDYAAKLAASQYSRGLAQQRGDRNIANTITQWQQRLRPLQSSYSRRNWLDSGTYKNALTDYTRNAYTAESDARQGLAGQLRQFDLSDAANRAAYQQQLADALAQKNQRIQEAAAALSGMNLFGGRV